MALKQNYAMPLEYNITKKLKSQNVDFVRFVSINHLHISQYRDYPNAIIFGISLSPEYIQEVINIPDYVQQRINNNFDDDDDELFMNEKKCDQLSDDIAAFLISKGYKAYSQSDKNQITAGNFDESNIKTLLPHKTIALMAGLGWIGKNNLLVTPEYGSGLCIGTVLTDAPLTTVVYDIMPSRCGNCNICKNVCQPNALKGHLWNNKTQREDMINIQDCTTCIKCLVLCPWTKAYMKKNMKRSI